MKHHINLYGAEFRAKAPAMGQPSIRWPWFGAAACCCWSRPPFFYGWQQRGVDRELAQVRRCSMCSAAGQRGSMPRWRAIRQTVAATAAGRQARAGCKRALIRQLGSLPKKSQGYAGVMADLARLRDARLSPATDWR